MAFNRRNPGDTDDEQAATEKLLKELRAERAQTQADLAAHKSAQSQRIEVPTTEQVLAMLAEMGELLTSAANSETDKEMRTARRIIDELTGGRIELFQMGERKAQRGWLQGRFRCDLVSVVIGKLTGVRPIGDDGNALEVVIDYREPRLIDEQADEAKRLWDQGLLCKAIAQEMGCLPSYVTKLLQHWFDCRGVLRPDNRRRRSELGKKQTDTPEYQRIAQDVIRQVDEGYSKLAIARQFKTSDTTVAKSIAWWCKSHGLPVPTAKDLRRKMLQRAKAMFDEGMLIKDIASELGYTSRGLKLALDKFLGELGVSMPDGRCRRGNADAGEIANGHCHGDSQERNDKA